MPQIPWFSSDHDECLPAIRHRYPPATDIRNQPTSDVSHHAPVGDLCGDGEVVRGRAASLEALCQQDWPLYTDVRNRGRAEYDALVPVAEYG